MRRISPPAVMAAIETRHLRRGSRRNLATTGAGEYAPPPAE
jgi:hypothetical protein